MSTQVNFFPFKAGPNPAPYLSAKERGYMNLNTDLRHGLSDRDLEALAQAQKKPINRFILTSGLVHVIAATAILITHHVPTSDNSQDLVEIQLSSPSAPDSAPEFAPVPEEVAKTIEPQKIEKLPEINQEPVQEQKITQTTPPSKSLPLVESQSAKPLAPKIPQNIPVQAQLNPKNAPVSQPESLDNIETPALDESDFTVNEAKPAEKLNPEELDQALNQVDQQHEEQLQAAAAQIDRVTEKFENSLEESANSAAEQIKKEDEATAALLAARADELRKQEEAQKAAALARAAENARAEKLAAAKIAAEKEVEAKGQRDAGPGKISTEVRALEQLRQMPGNPKPQYGSAERLKGDQGIVVFQAYVTQDGRLSSFKMLKSTGHRNLDGKTLKALKQWKFYPGQEGWVELPFDWNLKGGPQEMPTYLRRKVGQNPSF
jgi:TonB family protein